MQQTLPPETPIGLSADRRKSARLEDRYATALYELALDSKEPASAVDTTAAELASLQDAIATSPELARTLRNPVLGREGQAKALGAIAAKIGCGKLVQNFLRLVAVKGRQAQLPAIITAFHAIAAAARGELLAEVRSAAPLSDTQQQTLMQTLAQKHGAQSIRLNIIIDPSLLGGFSVKVGTKLYDSTLASQLNRLMLKLKEAA